MCKYYEHVKYGFGYIIFGKSGTYMIDEVVDFLDDKVNQLEQENNELKKALELACNDTTYLIKDWLTTEYYINQARETINEGE